MFGHTYEELRALKQGGYDPKAIYQANAELRQTLDMMRGGYFSPGNRDLFAPIVESLLNGDNYMLLADYESYLQCQRAVDAAYQNPKEWSQKAILNVANIGGFSIDRLVQQYANEVWHAAPVPRPGTKHPESGRTLATA
jgi:starch phosphorylase